MMSWYGFFFMNPSTILMESMILVHDYVMLIICSILIMVLYNIFYLFILNNFNLNFYEEDKLESLWTIIPGVILFSIIVPSLNVLYLMDSCLFCGISISILAHQWYWSYSYDNNIGNFDSYMLPKDYSFLRLLDVDNCLVVPFSVPIRFMLSSSDVIHSWTIPSMGVKVDAIPGRNSNFCFSAKRPGIFFGQCSEICGINHSFMPISLESVNLNNFMSL